MHETQKYITMLNELQSGVITPRSVVGGGYKNARKVAMEWIQTQIHNATHSERKVCQLHGDSKGLAFESQEKAVKSIVYKTLLESRYQTVNGLEVEAFGVCEACGTKGFLVFVKVGKPVPLSKRIIH